LTTSSQVGDKVFVCVCAGSTNTFSHHRLSSSRSTLNLGFLTKGKLPLHSSYLPLGVPNGLVIHHAQGRLLHIIYELAIVMVNFVIKWMIWEQRIVVEQWSTNYIQGSIWWALTPFKWQYTIKSVIVSIYEKSSLELGRSSEGIKPFERKWIYKETDVDVHIH
jgi:hypothetical protein